MANTCEFPISSTFYGKNEWKPFNAAGCSNSENTCNQLLGRDLVTARALGSILQHYSFLILTLALSNASVVALMPENNLTTTGPSSCTAGMEKMSTKCALSGCKCP
jgi:hypothetical protein